MATFELALPTILAHEGAFANNPHDPGRATNWGISLKFMQSINKNETITTESIKALTKEQAAAIYKKYFWQMYDYGKIADQSIATKIFDLAVNLGGKVAAIITQRAVRAAISWVLAEDGQLGIKSFTLINMAKPYMLMPALKSEAAGEYRLIAQRKPELSVFLNGWITRAYSDPNLAQESDVSKMIQDRK